MFKMEHVSARYSWLYAEYNEANHLATPESSELFRVQ